MLYCLSKTCNSSYVKLSETEWQNMKPHIQNDSKYTGCIQQADWVKDAKMHIEVQSQVTLKASFFSFHSFYLFLISQKKNALQLQ